MRAWLKCGATMTLLAAALLLPAAEGRSEDDADSQEAMRQKRLELLQARADSLVMHSGGESGPQLKRGEKPILR